MDLCVLGNSRGCDGHIFYCSSVICMPACLEMGTYNLDWQLVIYHYCDIRCHVLLQALVQSVPALDAGDHHRPA